METYFLGIDNGGSITKVAIYNTKGQELFVYQKNAEVVPSKKGFVERSSQDILTSVLDCIQGALQGSKIPAKDIAGVSVSCHGKGLYLLGKDDSLAYNGIISSDSRASDVIKELQSMGATKKIYDISFQNLWTGHPASILKWFAIHQPDILEKTKHIFMGHDFIRYYLTGEANAEVTNMSGSALVDVLDNNYSPALLKLLGLEGIKEALPPLINSCCLSGYVTKTASLETGLKEGTPVYAGFFDVVAAAISSGLVNSNEINLVMGTWAISTCMTEKIISSDYPYIWGNYCIENTFFAHEGSPTSASNLDWVIKNIIGSSKLSYDICNKLVAEAEADANLFFFPFLYASNISNNMSASLIGLKSHHDTKDILRAVYEGILFSHKMHTDRLVKIMENINAVSVVGGPTKSDVWMQMLADIMQKKVSIPNCKEAGCKGVSLAAMIGHGIYKDFEEATTHTIEVTTHYNPQRNSSYYAEKYQKYVEIGNMLSHINE